MDQAIVEVPKQFGQHLDAMMKQFTESSTRQVEMLEKRQSDGLAKIESNQQRQLEELKAMFQETRYTHKCRMVGDAASREPELLALGIGTKPVFLDSFLKL